MITTKQSSLLKIPLEVREKIYELCDKTTLSRLARTCKKVKAEINPPAEKARPNKYSPWNTLRARDYPGLELPTIEQPRSAKWLYRAASIISALEIDAAFEQTLFNSYEDGMGYVGSSMAHIDGGLEKEAKEKANCLLDGLEDI